MFEFIKTLFKNKAVDFTELLENGAVIIDVRSAGEFRTGHPKGAKNIPLQEIARYIPKIKKFNNPVITCCVSGRRSGIAAKQLKAAGIDAVNGGAWKNVVKFQ